MSIHIKIPWGEKYTINNAVFDLNGTLANNGEIAPSTKKLLKELAQQVNIYILTADTHNTAENLKTEFREFAEIIVLKSDEHAWEKARFVQNLEFRETVTLGNGGNDLKMVEEGILSFGIIGEEGIYGPLLSKVDIVVHSIDHAIKMLLHPMKIVATIRK